MHGPAGRSPPIPQNTPTQRQNQIHLGSATQPDSPMPLASALPAPASIASRPSQGYPQRYRTRQTDSVPVGAGWAQLLRPAALPTGDRPRLRPGTTIAAHPRSFAPVHLAPVGFGGFWVYQAVLANALRLKRDVPLV